MPVGEVIGFIGGALITCGFIPQVIRVFKLRSAREISLLFTILLLLGVLFWLTYGIAFGLPSVILGNAVTAVLVLCLLFAKLKYGREPGSKRGPGSQAGR